MNSDIQRHFEALRERLAAEQDLAPFNLLSLVRPSLRLSTERVAHERLGMGESRMGGLPDVPPGFEWPRWMPSRQRDDRCGQPWRPESPTPLGFMAQFALDTLPRVDDALPSTGWLYFFYDRYCETWGFDPADRGSCRVIYADCDRSRLTRAEAPAELDPEHLAHSCRVGTAAELTLPDDMPDIAYGTSAYKAYRAICDDLIQADGFTNHRLLGHPQLIQNPMERDCQFASNGIYCGGASYQSHEVEHLQRLEAGVADWRLLLQIDTDDDGPGWMWGDCGRIYFWIKKQDLAARQFADAWLILQCS